MPHFLAPSIALPSLPFTSGEYEFAYEAKCRVDSHQSLILVRFKKDDTLQNDSSGDEFSHNEFFLRKVKRLNKNNSIIKCEKSSKSQPTGIIKNALKALMEQQSNQHLITHNLNNNSPRQNLQSPFFKSVQHFLDFSQKYPQKCLIEVGFGSGRHLLHLAQNNPHLMCIGIEIHSPSIEQILRQIELLGLTNLYIIHTDARILLEILPPCIALGIYVHFPVPWNKKPHRRVFCKAFLEESLRVLDDNALLHLRSDDETYFRDALNLALSYKHINLQVQKNHKNAIVSKYEARWERQNKDIFDLKIFKTTTQGQDSCIKSAKNAQNTEKTFIFDKILRKNLDNYTNFPYKKIAKDWFLHIDNVYYAKDVYVLALCFGDFNQPQNKFLQISFDTSYSTHYVGGNPIPTKAAYKAHRHLMEFLSVDSKDKE